MNIVSLFEDGEGWRVLVFLRSKHRPSCYYEEGEKNILLSPAAVDLGGVCITPLEKDFNKMNKKLISEILREVSINKEYFEFVKAKLKKSFTD
jgi:hypothetical protein